MTRPGVSVKRVSADLERSFTELWMSSRVEGGTSPEVAARAASEGKREQARYCSRDKQQEKDACRPVETGAVRTAIRTSRSRGNA